jgi:hypothetical protein
MERGGKGEGGDQQHASFFRFASPSSSDRVRAPWTMPEEGEGQATAYRQEAKTDGTSRRRRRQETFRRPTGARGGREREEERVSHSCRLCSCQPTTTPLSSNSVSLLPFASSGLPLSPGLSRRAPAQSLCVSQQAQVDTAVTRRLTRFSFRPLPPQASPRAPPPLFQISSSLRSAASTSSVCLAEKGVLVRSLPLSPPFPTRPHRISTFEPRRTNSSTRAFCYWPSVPSCISLLRASSSPLLLHPSLSPFED